MPQVYNLSSPLSHNHRDQQNPRSRSHSKNTNLQIQPATFKSFIMRSNQLHNFKLPPRLTWGRQKILRCVNVNPVPANPPVDDNDHDNDDDDGDDEDSSDSGEDNHNHSVENPHISRRKRSSGNRRRRVAFNHRDSPPMPPPPQAVDPRTEKKPTRPRRNLDKKEERPTFSISLSRTEIEEDFIAITGKKPPRRSNKLPKNVQIKLNAVFPGSRLTEVHPDRYKVNESGFRSRTIRYNLTTMLFVVSGVNYWLTSSFSEIHNL